MVFTLTITTVLLLAVTALPMLRFSHWLVRDLDFPRLLFAVLALILLLTQLYTLDFRVASSWLLIAVTLVCLSGQLWWILPYTPLWRTEVAEASKRKGDARLSIITANVLATNRNAQVLLDLVQQHQPDILVTLESNQWWQDQQDALHSTMPYSVQCPQENLYGMHIYSRLALEESEIKFLVEKDAPSIHALVLTSNGDSVRMHFLHPAPPSPTENTESAQRDAELIIVARSVAKSEQPVIVTGDLNDVAWSPTTRLFRKVSGLLDPRVGRGMFNTFHARIPFLRWPLDHLFHSSHFTIEDLQRLPPIGSDHFALFAELRYCVDVDKNAAGLMEKEADEIWGDSIVESQNVIEADVPRPGE